MAESVQPIFILPEGYTRTSGKDAQRNNIAAAKAVANAVKSTLGQNVFVNTIEPEKYSQDFRARLESV